MRTPWVSILRFSGALRRNLGSPRQRRRIAKLHFDEGLFSDAQRAGAVVQVQLDENDHGGHHEDQHGNERVPEVLQGPDQNLD